MSDNEPDNVEYVVVASFERANSEQQQLICLIDAETLTPDEQRRMDAVIRNGTPLGAGLACVGHF